VILVLTLLGFLLFLAVISLKRFLIPWHESVVGVEQGTGEQATT
jgi:ABC-type nitrate/sulfonate/bicarbonate transport system permease component